MEKLIQESVLSHFGLVEDPRVQGRCKHSLIDVIAISVCARICGAESFVEMEEFGIQREAWFREFLSLENGIPSHDTLARVFSILDSKALENAFLQWTKCVTKKLGVSPRISLDGKSLNGTCRGFNQPSRPLILVNVFCHATGLTLAQTEAPSTGNAESSAAMECLEALDIEKTLISVDAGLGKKTVLKKIREKKAHYVTPVKADSKLRFKELIKHVNQAKKLKKVRVIRSTEKSRDRVEIRECRIISPAGLSGRFRESFPETQCVIEMKRVRNTRDLRYVVQQRDKKGKIRYLVNTNKSGRKQTTETILYVSSCKLSPESALREIRAHWGIENQLHWSLDVIFNEDGNRVRDKVTARNLAVIRKIAFNLLQNCTEKGSKRVKMKRAAWNSNYLQKLLLAQDSKGRNF